MISISIHLLVREGGLSFIDWKAQSLRLFLSIHQKAHST